MAGDTDMKPHEQTYGSVIALLKWGAVGCLIVAAIVIWLISSGGAK
ncbi:aa3-type cytochrome c oxidase subunit IV [Sphingomonas sp.]|nr:aa3-type cytochrome c oxidase subunit IV [Sphingomonas sp.]